MRNAVHVKSWLTYIHGAREIVDDAWRQRASAGSSQAPIPLHLAASCHYGGLHRPCSPPLLCILAPRQPFRYRHCHLLSTGACAQLCTTILRYDHESMEFEEDRFLYSRDSFPFSSEWYVRFVCAQYTLVFLFTNQYISSLELFFLLINICTMVIIFHFVAFHGGNYREWILPSRAIFSWWWWRFLEKGDGFLFDLEGL